MGQGTIGTAPENRMRRRFGWPQITVTHALAMLGGGLLVHLLGSLPPVWCGSAAMLLALPLICHRSHARLPGWFLLGLALNLLHAQAALDARLPAAWRGEDFDIVGRIRGLPDAMPESTRFEFEIESASQHGRVVNLRGLARLNWYERAPVLQPCTRWQLRARLRPPRGLVNPGGYDSERGAIQHGVVAVGYVRNAPDSRLIASADALCIDGWRSAISHAIAERIGPGTASSLLRALAVGDQHAISEDDWQVLRATGIGHLIAISGLHVGMLAALGALIARRLWKWFPKLTLRVPGPILEAPMALAFALGYGLLAGMGVPTIRTVLMIAVVLVARLSRRAVSVSHGLALAAVSIMLFDPLAVLAAGFWLSFAGVAILLALTQPAGVRRAAWRELPRLQLVLSLALLPLTVWLFGQGSLVGPLANLMAVPLVSFVVVPITLCASLLILPFPLVGGLLLDWASVLLMALWKLMQVMAALPAAQHYFAQAPIWAFVLATLGVAWALLPRGVPARGLGLCLLLPLLVPHRTQAEHGGFGVWMFDVGQGLSVLVRTGGHSLLYDAGPRYPSGYDLAETVVIPSLHALGVDRLDRLVISHGDGDHAGGTEAVHRAFPDTPIESGEPERLGVPATACRSGTRWQWDGVDFQILAAGGGASRGNDRSCVLAVSGRFGSLLLSGDLTTREDRSLVDQLPALAQPLILGVAHHGSRNASSEALLDALRPRLGLVSAGFRNQFGHPHPELVERFRERSIELINTADNGYLHVELGENPGLPERGRDLRSAWWRVH